MTSARPAESSRATGTSTVHPLFEDPLQGAAGEGPHLPDGAARWADARLVADLLAVDPVGLGGVHLQCGPGPVREAWLGRLQQACEGESHGVQHTTLRRLPQHADDSRLIGGLDLTATLQEGRPKLQKGLLAELDGHILVCPMAERLPRRVVSHLTQALDRQEVRLERDGLSSVHTSRFGLVAIDEADAAADESPIEAALGERLAFQLNLQGIDWRLTGTDGFADPLNEFNGDDDVPCPAEMSAARAALSGITVSDAVTDSLVQAAVALGIASLRVPWWAVQATRALAALRGLPSPGQAEVVDAARLVMGPRATRLPSATPPEESSAEDQAAQPDSSDSPEPTPQDAPPPVEMQDQHQAPPAAQPPPAIDQDDPSPEPQQTQDPLVQDLTVAAIAAALPAGLLAMIAQQHGLNGGRQGRSAPAPSRAGERQKAGTRGRPVGVRPGSPEQGHRLSLIDTLRQAAPWQSLRRGLQTKTHTDEAAPPPRIIISREDLRIVARQPRRPTTTVFLVDASGSNALNRLAEAKGAVETMLADCYVRRDRVAVLGFRGQTAETLLPPTRSLVRAKRSLAGLPGGGGTPMARALVDARVLCEGLGRRGDTVSLVLLTDGKANVTLEGRPGREQAQADAILAARELAASGVRCLLVDTSPKPQAQARELALAMRARYIPLPQARTGEIGRIVRNSLAA